jgi:hypothetical protein
MSFKRPPPSLTLSDERTLTAALAGIGMNFATPPDPDAPIEETLVRASAAGMDEGDLRVLSVLTTWLGVHARHIHADRLIRCVAGHPSVRVRAFWAAVGRWLAKDRRFARLEKLHEGPPQDLLPVGTDFQIQRRGEDERFAGGPIRVPSGTLRERPADVLSPVTLARRHAGYRNRVLIGPTWRADIWTALERSPDASVADVARCVGCSFAAAWQVVQDFALFRASYGVVDGSKCIGTSEAIHAIPSSSTSLDIPRPDDPP